MNNPEILVIGGGPGGYVAAIRAAQLGGKVTLIEKSEIGGTCLNRGCMPTKALLHAAALYNESKNAENYGISFENVIVDWKRVQQFRKSVVSQLTNGVRSLLRANKVNVVFGEASFVSEKKIIVNDKEYTGDYIIIATGSSPIVPHIAGINSERSIDSTACIELSSLPKSLAIIGGGVIGVELGYVYSSFGAEVTILEKASTILPAMDKEISCILSDYLKKCGIKILTNCEVDAIEEIETDLAIKVDCRDRKEDVLAEKVFYCIGRQPQLGALNVEKAGIIIEDGQIKTDKNLQTNIKGIYAIGDCTGRQMLAHAAMQMGEIAAENIFGAGKSYDIDTTPSCCYVGPELAGVGLTEERAKSENIDYVVGRFPTIANGRSVVTGATGGIIKIIVGRQYGEILGAHILAANATEIIQQVTLAMKQELTVEELIENSACHPTVSEALREAALAVNKKSIHFFSA